MERGVTLEEVGKIMTQKWYATKEEIRKDRPVLCNSSQGGKELLIPQNMVCPRIGDCDDHNAKTYEVISYNWFNLKKGTWGSAVPGQTFEQALAIRSEEEVFNPAEDSKMPASAYFG